MCQKIYYFVKCIKGKFENKPQATVTKYWTVGSWAIPKFDNAKTKGANPCIKESHKSIHAKYFVMPSPGGHLDILGHIISTYPGSFCTRRVYVLL